jgi:hypothetical protein
LATLGRVAPFLVGRRGPERKISWKELKSKDETFEMILPGIPEKVVKGFSVRKEKL